MNFATLTLIMGMFLTSNAIANSNSEGDELTKSKLDKNGKYINPVPTNLGDPKDMIKMFLKTIKGGHKDRVPPMPLPITYADEALKMPPSDSLRFTWLGHSMIVLEIEGKRFIFDPMFSQRASPFEFAGPKRFHPVPLDLENLPHFDAVILTHDHYDHFDKKAVRMINDGETKFYAPLGIKEKLLDWGVADSNAFELDWWDEIVHDGITLAATPARHFSGRSMFNMNHLLWCSWVVIGETHRIYFSGDSGIMPVFKDIGDKFGPFDLTFLENGAYDELWHDVHMIPPEHIDAQAMLGGKIMVPIHYGTFNLAYHAWYEPPEWLAKEAEKSGMKLLTPRIGETVDPWAHVNEYWWRELIGD